MATPKQERVLRVALRRAAKKHDLTMTDLALDFLVERASNHIERRYLSEEVRSDEFTSAEKSAQRLAKNLAIFFSPGKISRKDVEIYIAESASCFYPWCKPE